MAAMRRLKIVLPRWLCLAAAGIALLALAAHFQGALWITDAGNKQIILRNFAEYGQLNIVNPAVELDPDNAFFPYAGFHFLPHDGDIFSFYPVFYPLLNRPFVAVFGRAGLGILPLAGGLLAALLLFGMVRAIGHGKQYGGMAAFTLIAATPLLFYMMIYWESSLACAVAAAATLTLIHALRSERTELFLLSGMLFAAGLFLREEFYLLCAAAGGIVVVSAPRKIAKWGMFAIGGFAVAATYWSANTLLYGTPLGLHVSSYWNAEENPLSPTRLLENISVFLFRFDTGLPKRLELAQGFFFAGAAVIGLLSPGFHSFRKLKTICCALACVIWSVSAWRLFTSQEPITQTLFTIALIAGNPIFFFAVLNLRPLWNCKNRLLRPLSRIILIYTGLATVLLSCHDMGILWGARHFLILFPGMVLCSLYAAQRARSRVFLPLLLALSIGFQIHSIIMLDQMETNLRRMDEAVRNMTDDVIVSDVFFLPELTPDRFFDRRFLTPGKEGDLTAIGQTLSTAKIKSCSLILSSVPGLRRVSDQELAAFLKRYPATAVMEMKFRGTKLLNLLIVNCKAAD